MTNAHERLQMLDSMRAATWRSHGYVADGVKLEDAQRAAVKCDACSRVMQVYVWWLEEHRDD